MGMPPNGYSIHRCCTVNAGIDDGYFAVATDSQKGLVKEGLFLWQRLAALRGLDMKDPFAGAKATLARSCCGEVAVRDSGSRSDRTVTDKTVPWTFSDTTSGGASDILVLRGGSHGVRSASPVWADRDPRQRR